MKKHKRNIKNVVVSENGSEYRRMENVGRKLKYSEFFLFPIYYKIPFLGYFASLKNTCFQSSAKRKFKVESSIFYIRWEIFQEENICFLKFL